LRDILAPQARNNPTIARQVAERMTRNRASRLIRQSDTIAMQTLYALSSAVRSSSQIPGRKLFVFVSDGFLIHNQNPDVRYRLQRITDAAVRGGAVVYTIQASGLNTSFPDASSDAMLIAGTGTGRVTGEDTAVQDPLTQLAADTGGHALLNANDLNRSVKRALQESNDYYLLAWRPDPEKFQGKEFHHIEVNVKSRSDLSVLVQSGFFNDKTSVAAVGGSSPSVNAGALPDGRATAIEDLAGAIKGKLSSRALPVFLTANYLDLPNRGAGLSILMQADRATTESGNGGKPGTVDVAGVIYNDSGKVIGSFVESLRSDNSESEHVTYLNQFDVKPGLYQVRGAARDSGGSTGMASQWVKVPDLGSHSLALSSLLIGERELTRTPASGDAVQFQKAQLKIDRRFVRNSRLRFLTFIYNAASDAVNQAPRLNARVDLFQGNKVVVSTPSFAVETRSVEDPARIPYAGEFKLAALPKGHYRMRVTVIDLSVKTYASQETSFDIE